MEEKELAGLANDVNPELWGAENGLDGVENEEDPPEVNCGFAAEMRRVAGKETAGEILLNAPAGSPVAWKRTNFRAGSEGLNGFRERAPNFLTLGVRSSVDRSSWALEVALALLMLQQSVEARMREVTAN